MAQIWTESLCRHLMGTYSYDKELGEVTRKVWEVKGPKNTGALGTLSERGDWLLVVAFEGKSWTLRMARLAIFLETGEQYHKVEFKDGDSSNLVYENLIPLGKPVASEQEYVEQVEGIAESKINKFKAMRDELARDRLAKSVAQAETKRLEKLAKKQSKEDSEGETLEAISKRDEEAVKKAKTDHYMEHVYKGILVPPKQIEDGVPPFKDELDAIWAEHNEKLEKVRHLTGIFVWCSASDAEKFMEDCNRNLGEKTDEEILGDRNRPWDSIDNKVEHDRLWIAYWRDYVKREGESQVAYERYIARVKWKGKFVEGKYGEVPKWLQEETSAKMKECFDRNGWPDGRRPHTEEEIAGYKEACRVHEELCERVRAGESFLDDIKDS